MRPRPVVDRVTSALVVEPGVCLHGGGHDVREIASVRDIELAPQSDKPPIRIVGDPRRYWLVGNGDRHERLPSRCSDPRYQGLGHRRPNRRRRPTRRNLATCRSRRYTTTPTAAGWTTTPDLHIPIHRTSPLHRTVPFGFDTSTFSPIDRSVSCRQRSRPQPPFRSRAQASPRALVRGVRRSRLSGGLGCAASACALEFG